MPTLGRVTVVSISSSRFCKDLHQKLVQGWQFRIIVEVHGKAPLEFTQNSSQKKDGIESIIFLLSARIPGCDSIQQ